MATMTVRTDEESGWTIIRADGLEIIRMRPDVAQKLCQDIRVVNSKRCPCDDGWTYSRQDGRWAHADH